jgi:pimeloyl-ACP methyl ester carboxylesterase
MSTTSRRDRVAPRQGSDVRRCSALHPVRLRQGGRGCAPEALAGRQLLDGWSVTDRLGEITVPTLVMAGREDFLFSPPCQQEPAAGVPGLQLVVIDGDNPQDEQTGEVIGVLRRFLAGKAASA